jgi:hypothetical protein
MHPDARGSEYISEEGNLRLKRAQYDAVDEQVDRLFPALEPLRHNEPSYTPNLSIGRSVTSQNTANKVICANWNSNGLHGPEGGKIRGLFRWSLLAKQAASAMYFGYLTSSAFTLRTSPSFSPVTFAVTCEDFGLLGSAARSARFLMASIASLFPALSSWYAFPSAATSMKLEVVLAASHSFAILSGLAHFASINLPVHVSAKAKVENAAADTAKRTKRTMLSPFVCDRTHATPTHVACRHFALNWL